MQIGALGEQKLLQRLQEFCPPEIIGDDAAVLPLQAGQSLVVTTDMLVDGIHFSDRTTSAQDAGWRAAAANLSDLAAMGATPLGITVALGLPSQTAVSWVEALYQGITDCLNQYQTPLVGGDVCRSPVRTISITAFGQVDPDRAIRRGLARPGDAILTTGFHGASRAGLELLLNPESAPQLRAEERQFLIQAHQRPLPRLDILPLLTELAPERVAGMDSSDGLADAVLQICRASGVGAILEQESLPLPIVFTRWPGVDQGLNWSLYGGEDFELVLCLPPAEAEVLVARFGSNSRIIGKITDHIEETLLYSSQGEVVQALNPQLGFQHFKND